MARYTALVAIAGTLFLGAAGLASARKPAPAPANGPAAQIARGDKIFQTNCAACHGHGSGGDDYLTGEHWKYLPGTLAIYVKYQMPYRPRWRTGPT
ncbi:c-type cytochrome [Sphingobium sp. DC-2]|uniref:c-type cytochrome n=1 Tax=Sphingobium sp. DC-2 TaxID=1303256 RepID=UPI0009DFB00F|nr:c-type cytochrome [Sphingobium sp. DC-2]